MAIQSVYNGTWGGETCPQEIVDFELCREMHLSWQELQETPFYVQRVWWDCIMAKREAENEQERRSNSRHEREQGTRRVKW